LEKIMTILFEENIRTASVKDVAAKMMLAARTAPKARGLDNLVIALAEKEEIKKIAEEMRRLAAMPDFPMASSFQRDAENILLADALFLIGTKIKVAGVGYCGLCGFANCQEKNSRPNTPCFFNANDLGIAVGSAVSVAFEHRVDNRVMYTVGMAVRNLGLLGKDVKICLGIPLSATGKNVFFDRK
jgi:uncharacterized ferredoxin-like protein